MKSNQSSQSAAGVALMRAIESQKPESERIIYDPFAYDMIQGGISYSLLKWIIASRWYEKISHGALAFVILRERFIDDFLKLALEKGVEQAVILGAGFDTRAYRITDIEKIPVFEVDQPATQTEKIKRLDKILSTLPKHVTFVELDLNKQDLLKELAAKGYREKVKTLFICQGLIYFLSAKAVDDLLAFISQHSGQGSSIIFDFFYTETLRNGKNGYAQSLKRAARISGEEYMFGIDKGKLEEFLYQRGFSNVHQTSILDLKKKYFTGINFDRSVPDGIAIASAEVHRS